MIHKILVLLKITIILKRLLKSIIDFTFFKKPFFSQHLVMESSLFEEESIIKDLRNFFRLKKELHQIPFLNI